MSFDLDLPYLEELWQQQDGCCYHYGIPLARDGAAANSPARVSIDRINGDEGYLKGNVILTCMAANFARNRFSVSVFSRFTEHVLEHAPKRHKAKMALRTAVHRHVRAILVSCYKRDAKRLQGIAKKAGCLSCSVAIVTGELASFCLHFETDQAADDFLRTLKYAPAVTAIDATGACNA